VGSKPGSSQFHLFSHIHHFTAEPQRLPKLPNFGLICNKLQKQHIFLGYLTPRKKSYVLVLTSNGLSYTLGAFFPNSSGHTEGLPDIFVQQTQAGKNDAK
jgi:hypothetical protein